MKPIENELQDALYDFECEQTDEYRANIYKIVHTIKEREYHKGRADMKAEYESADIPIIHGKSELEEHDKKIRAEAIKELLKEFHPCKYCQSNEDGNCCDKDYFEDCCIEENSISYSELIEFADKLKEK